MELGHIVVRAAEAERLHIPAEHLKIEVRKGGRWTQVSEADLT